MVLVVGHWFRRGHLAALYTQDLLLSLLRVMMVTAGQTRHHLLLGTDFGDECRAREDCG